MEWPRPEVERALSVYQAPDGVMVSLDWLKYAVVRCLVLHHETPIEPPRFIEEMLSLLTNSRPLPRQITDYYIHVIAAVLLKRDDKLMLKTFKEVPVSALEQLLPDFDHAEDELFNECLLICTILLTHRPLSAQSKHSTAQNHEELGLYL